MRVKINSDRCMGNGVCTSIAPEAFVIDDEGYAQVTEEQPGGALAAQVAEAADLCPTNAIEIEDD